MTTSKKVYIVGISPQVSRMFFDHGYEIIQGDNAQEKSDIVVFLGGADINPKFYNQEPNPAARISINKRADDMDHEAWNKRKEGQTMVGICRGGQFLNVMSGGSMIQHVGNHTREHKMFDTIWNKEVTTSSCHHQMMIPTDEAEMFAYSEGIGSGHIGERGPINGPKYEPEVVWYQRTRSLCFQGHPEWHPKESTDYFFDLVRMVT